MCLQCTGWVFGGYFIHFLAMYLQCTCWVHRPLPPVWGAKTCRSEYGLRVPGSIDERKDIAPSSSSDHGTRLRWFGNRRRPRGHQRSQAGTTPRTQTLATVTYRSPPVLIICSESFVQFFHNINARSPSSTSSAEYQKPLPVAIDELIISKIVEQRRVYSIYYKVL